MLIMTFKGNLVDPANPDPLTFDIEDIAHALSLICRYNGHIPEFYSVAQHSYHVAQLLPVELKLWGLLHDASEAYFADVIRPAKELLTDYEAVEAKIHAAIAKRFKLEFPVPQYVLDADNTMLLTEMVKFGYPFDWTKRLSIRYGVIPDATFRFDCWTSQLAEKMFLGAFNKYFEGV